MKFERNRTLLKVASYLLFASILFSSLSLHPTPVLAQAASTGSPSAGSPSSSTQSLSATWDLDFDLSVPQAQLETLGGMEQAQAQVESMLSSKQLKQRGVNYDVKQKNSNALKVHLNGSNDVNQLREMLFTQLAPELDLLDGPVALNLTAKIKKDQPLPVILESRPSTGFVWDLSQNNLGVAVKDQKPVVQSQITEAGAPAKEQLHMKSTTTGDATISLIYHRPWDTSAPTRTLTMRLSAFPDQLDLSNPEQPVASAAPQLDAPMVTASTTTLPSHFDWRDQGKLPPVRDQGGCGSCWAFGTVGAMESAMMVQAGASADLSEQYLISCNKEGWGCNGGWWAHDYHLSNPGTYQTSAGAVLESTKPYAATKGTCTINYNHPYKLASWGYISGSYSTTPSVDQIKTAIYQYGGVAAAVCTGTGWGNYQAGTVFSTNESSQCGGTVNHAILLVGWDDPGQYWILRNSWGSGWGEGGYMRIKWGISNVGYGATYVVYNQTAPAPAPSPTPSPTPVPAPSNDNIDNATVINHSNGSITFQDRPNTLGATNDTRDPYFPFLPKRQGYHTVWYRITPVWTGRLAVNTLGSAYDTILGVWTKDSTGAMKLVKWNDNYSTRVQSSLAFITGIGVEYYIEVASKTTKAGLLAFNLSYTPNVPPNDRIAYARIIRDAGLGLQTNFSMIEDVSRATVTLDEPLLVGDSRGRGYHTVWFRFTPVQNGVITALTTGSNYNTILGAWKILSTGRVWIGMNDDYSGQQAGFQINAVKGVPYLIGVLSNDLTGPSILNFSFNFKPN